MNSKKSHGPDSKYGNVKTRKWFEDELMFRPAKIGEAGFLAGIAYGAWWLNQEYCPILKKNKQAKAERFNNMISSIDNALEDGVVSKGELKSINKGIEDIRDISRGVIDSTSETYKEVRENVKISLEIYGDEELSGSQHPVKTLTQVREDFVLIKANGLSEANFGYNVVWVVSGAVLIGCAASAIKHLYRAFFKTKSR
ncbi:hypothetical protein ACFL1H_01380 [Nanoarchaeota archaeon]